MKFNALVFDLDGTIADTIPFTIHCIREVVRELTGIVLVDEEIKKEFGPVDTKIIEKFLNEDKKEAGVELYIKYFSDNFKEFVTPIDGISGLIEYLKRNGYKVGLFTGRGYIVTKIILQKLELDGSFDMILTGDDTTRPKPDPEGILKVLDKLKVRPSESIYTGDFDVDILASKAAGAFSVLALWSSSASSDLIKHNPEKYFRSPYEFIEWLQGYS